MHILKNLLTILLILISFLTHGQGVVNGEIDLSKENFENHIFDLDGKWDFSWETDYKDFSSKQSIQIPGFWNDKDNGNFPVFGQGCYQTMITLPKGEEKLAIRVNDVHNSYAIFVNGNLLHKNGNPSLKKEEYIGDWSTLVLPFEIDTNIIELTFVVANYGHRNGGFSSSIFIGRVKNIIDAREYHYMVDILVIGGLFLLIAFLFGMFLLWRKDNALIYFLAYGVLYGLWMSFREEKPFFTVFPNIDWTTAIRLEYFALIGSVLFFIIFVSRLFPKQKIKLLHLFYIIVTGISIALIFILPSHLFTYLAISNLMVMATFTFYFIYVLIRVWVEKENESKLAIASLLVFLLVIILESVSFLGVAEINKVLMRMTSLSFLLSIAFIFAYRFSGAFNNEVDLKNIAEQQQKKLTIKTNEVYASIQYAKQLQNTILPTRKEVEKHFQKSFILYIPKDIVSGDFYWMEESNGLIYFAAADCTGHGVPGAMVSFVCSNALSKSVLEDGKSTPENILTRTREIVIERFSTSETSLNDGMDISLGAYNPETRELIWSGANNSIWIIKKGANNIEETKGDKQPIGNYLTDLLPFKLHTFKMKKGDRVYLFTDGFVDQFGGEKGKKFKTHQLKNFVLNIQNQPISNHHKILEDSFNNWKGSYEQIDDVCVFGIEF